MFIDCWWLFIIINRCNLTVYHNMRADVTIMSLPWKNVACFINEFWPKKSVGLPGWTQFIPMHRYVASFFFLSIRSLFWRWIQSHVQQLSGQWILRIHNPHAFSSIYWGQISYSVATKQLDTLFAYRIKRAYLCLRSAVRDVCCCEKPTTNIRINTIKIYLWC